MLYIYRRKKVGVLAADFWKGKSPKFNTPQMKADLANFAKDIAPQCAMPEIGFNVDGIMTHVQNFFNEQRRYKNRKPSFKVFSYYFLSKLLCKQVLLGGKDLPNESKIICKSKSKIVWY